MEKEYNFPEESKINLNENTGSEEIREPDLSYSVPTDEYKSHMSTNQIIQELAEKSLQQYKEGKYICHNEMEKKHPL